MTYQMRIRAVLYWSTGTLTGDHARRRGTPIVETRRRPGRVTITEQALRVRRHQRRLGVASPPDLISITGRRGRTGLPTQPS
jgi:hypothetical protein